LKTKFFRTMLTAILVLVLCFAFTAPAVATEYNSSLILENKNPSTWAVFGGDDVQGTLEFNSSGPEFEFSLVATGLTPGVEYALIYYTDTEDRFVDWGGSNGAVIATGEASDGNLAISGSTELGMDLPCPQDANGYFYDYTQTSDGYSNVTGAKIWLVPSSALTNGVTLPIVVWAPSTFLFETDLITYDDTDIVSLKTEVVDDIIQLNITPTSFDFGQLHRGESSAELAVSITNEGNMAVKVTATSESAFYNASLAIGGVGLVDWSQELAEKASCSPPLQVTVPLDWPSGVESGTIIFWAQAP